MLKYIAVRIFDTIPVALIVCAIVFLLLFVASGDPAALIAGEQASPQEVQTIRERLGLDRPYLVQFGDYLWRLFQGDLGVSVFTGKPVLAMIGERLEPTISLMALTLVIALALAIPMGILAAWKAGRAADRVVTSFSVLGFSMPAFVIGYSLAYVFALEFRLLPVQGYVRIGVDPQGWLRSLVLPSVTLGVVYMALIARTTRSAVLEVLGQDYIRTAKSKGLTNKALLFRHALGNASNPIVTVVCVGLAHLLSGAVVTETVFALPGLGRLTVDAVLQRDYPVIQGIILLFSLLYVLANLLADILYAYFDPRIRY